MKQVSTKVLNPPASVVGHRSLAMFIVNYINYSSNITNNLILVIVHITRYNVIIHLSMRNMIPSALTYEIEMFFGIVLFRSFIRPQNLYKMCLSIENTRSLVYILRFYYLTKK